MLYYNQLYLILAKSIKALGHQKNFRPLIYFEYPHPKSWARPLSAAPSTKRKSWADGSATSYLAVVCTKALSWGVGRVQVKWTFRTARLRRAAAGACSFVRTRRDKLMSEASCSSSRGRGVWSAQHDGRCSWSINYRI